MKDIDSVPSKVQSARQEALLYVFEDNEAVIKMIIKGRSPTMRHVSRTHRVALDWLFDRINLDSTCILEASESTRMRMEETLSTYHEDQIAGKVDKSPQHTIWHTNLFLCFTQ